MKKSNKIIVTFVIFQIMVVIPFNLHAQVSKEPLKAIRNKMQTMENKGMWEEAINYAQLILADPINEYTADAYALIAHCYLHGHHYEQDVEKAVEKYTEASSLSSKYTNKLIELYLENEYTKQDLNKVLSLLEFAHTNHSSNMASAALATIYSGGYMIWGKDTVRIENNIRYRSMIPQTYYFPNVKTDKKKAFEYVKHFDEPGSNADYFIGTAYMDGELVEVDYYKAFQFLYEDVPRGNSYKLSDYENEKEQVGDACWRISILYRYGRGVPSNEILADEYAEIAAKLDNLNALDFLKIR